MDEEGAARGEIQAMGAGDIAFGIGHSAANDDFAWKELTVWSEKLIAPRDDVLDPEQLPAPELGRALEEAGIGRHLIRRHAFDGPIAKGATRMADAPSIILYSEEALLRPEQLVA